MHFAFDVPNECPLCHFGIEPKKLSLVHYWHENSEKIAILYLCAHCGRAFMAFFNVGQNVVSINDKIAQDTSLDYVGPKYPIEKRFDEKISALSPQFVKIYNQSAAAEAYGLDEIAGIGYRKALEFLTKDFCIHTHPEEEEQIKSLFLSRCITDYIDNDKIKTLSTKAAWIGNDETHYVRAIDGRTVEDMKTFIQAMVFYVGAELVTEDALSISPV